MDITLLELHLPDAEFNAPFARGRASGPTDGTEPDDAATAQDPSVDDRAAGSRVGPVAALLAIVGLALLARYLRGGEAEQATLDELEA